VSLPLRDRIQVSYLPILTDASLFIWLRCSSVATTQAEPKSYFGQTPKLTGSSRNISQQL
jgi:hypothetical protein